jgi:cycloeucalenol cycloisomerase
MSLQPSSWFAADPGKAWAERFFLLYSPIWIALVAWALLSGAVLTWDDPTYLAFGLVCGAPPVLVPALLHRRVPALRGVPWHQSYWLKYNVWIFLFVFVGTYFLTHYFFDVLGMRYAFPTRWNGGAALVGRARPEIPLFMYPLTQAYFVTYHVVMLVLLRRARGLLGLPAPGAPDMSPGSSRFVRRLALAVVTVVLAYGVAFAETWFMASDAIAAYFGYADKPRMLQYGSLFYACYFLVSLPLLSRLDEPAGARTPLGQAVLSSLAAGMLVFFILDLLTWIIGPIA